MATRQKQKRPAKRRSGPKPSITREVVVRVAERIGRGLTLELALAAEARDKVNLENWKKAMVAHPELRAIYHGGKARFVDEATRRLAEDEDLGHLKWLLMKRHADLFTEIPAASVHVDSQVNVEIPPDILARAQELAKTGGQS